MITTTELFARVLAAAPGFAAVMDQHLADHQELLPHVLMADDGRFIASYFTGPSSIAGGVRAEDELGQVLSVLETAMIEGDDETQNVIAVSFVEHLWRWTGTIVLANMLLQPDTAGDEALGSGDTALGGSNMALVAVGLTRSASCLPLLGLVLVGCGFTSESQPSVPRYLVTARPIDVGVGPGLCIAVDPVDRHGVWWWQPGGSGCTSRSTGPGVFHAAGARVSQSAQSGPIALSFRLGTHSETRPFVDVRLVLESSGDLQAVESGARVPIHRRNDLDVPEWR